jgi:hypothetical protein
MLGAGAAVAGWFILQTGPNQWDENLSGDEQRLQQAGIIHCRMGKSFDWMDHRREVGIWSRGKFPWASMQREIQRVYCSPWCVSANILRIPNAEIQ